ncbi:MAG: hypothetical protein ACRYFX_00925 [Janthinobacterium lividum]
MSRAVRNFTRWPLGTPLPAAALLWFYDPKTDDEYSFVPGQLGAQGGSNAQVLLLVDASGPTGLAAAKKADFGALYEITGDWNAGANVGVSVVVVGLPDGSFADSGLLLLAGGGSQMVDVDVAAGTYAAAATGGATLDPGTVLHFNQPLTLHPTISTGSFSVDTSAMIPGSEESIVLGPGATLPTTADTTVGGVTTPAALDPTIFHTTSPAPQAGRVLEYLFRVGYDGQHVEYLVTDITP